MDGYNYNNLTRQQCENLLENVGIACYDSESDDVLREAVKVNVEDGTINPDDLP